MSLAELHASDLEHETVGSTEPVHEAITYRTGEHIIHMRALALSDRWDDAMKIVFKPPRVRVRAVAA